MWGADAGAGGSFSRRSRSCKNSIRSSSASPTSYADSMNRSTSETSARAIGGVHSVKREDRRGRRRLSGDVEPLENMRMKTLESIYGTVSKSPNQPPTKLKQRRASGGNSSAAMPSSAVRLGPLTFPASGGGLASSSLAVSSSGISSRLDAGLLGKSASKSEDGDVESSGSAMLNVFSTDVNEYMGMLKGLPSSEAWARMGAHVAQLKWCRTLLALGSDLSRELALEPATHRIIESTRKMLNCDRVTMYNVNHTTHQLTASISRDVKGMSIRVGQGIAGEVAATGKWLLVEDAYNDARFCPDVDRRTGYRTRSVLCGPIRDGNDRIIAVLQAINKSPRGGGSGGDGGGGAEFGASGHQLTGVVNFASCVPFGPDDVAMLQCVASVAGVALQNSKLFTEVRRNSDRSESMLEMLRTFSTELDVDSAVDRIIDCAYQILKADRVSLYLVDADAGELVCRVSQDVKGIRIPMTCGIAGHVAQHGKIISVPNAYKDKRFNPQVDVNTGYRTRCILCGPIHDMNGEVVAVVQAINKKESASSSSGKGGKVFDEEDEMLLSGITSQAGIALTNATLYNVERQARCTSDALVEVAKSLSSELRIHPLIDIIMTQPATSFCSETHPTAHAPFQPRQAAAPFFRGLTHPPTHLFIHPAFS